MKRILFAAALLVAAGAVPATAAPGKTAKSKKGTPKLAVALVKTATPKQENQFVTVEEFIKAKRAPKTAVSIEGYAVVGYAIPGGGSQLTVVDGVDHVLSATDAMNFAKAGAICSVPGSLVVKHPAWGSTAKGLQKVLMYTGPGKAQKMLHDTPTKVRVTGWAEAGRNVSVTKVEYADDNGDWKVL
jgi:hypothetical protein